MAKCPFGDHEAKLPNHAYHNADSYNQSCYVKSDCCGNIVYLAPIRAYRIEQAHENIIVDDWGIRKAPHNPEGKQDEREV